MLPDDNNLSDRCYEAKKILCIMGLEYIKIHVCRNDWILYKKEYEKLNQYSKCRESRYKMKDNNGDNDDDDVSNKCPPAKV